MNEFRNLLEKFPNKTYFVCLVLGGDPEIQFATSNKAEAEAVKRLLKENHRNTLIKIMTAKEFYDYWSPKTHESWEEFVQSMVDAASGNVDNPNDEFEVGVTSTFTRDKLMIDKVKKVIESTPDKVFAVCLITDGYPSIEFITSNKSEADTVLKRNLSKSKLPYKILTIEEFINFYMKETGDSRSDIIDSIIKAANGEPLNEGDEIEVGKFSKSSNNSVANKIKKAIEQSPKKVFAVCSIIDGYPTIDYITSDKSEAEKELKKYKKDSMGISHSLMTIDEFIDFYSKESGDSKSDIIESIIRIADGNPINEGDEFEIGTFSVQPDKSMIDKIKKMIESSPKKVFAVCSIFDGYPSIDFITSNKSEADEELKKLRKNSIGVPHTIMTIDEFIDFQVKESGDSKSDVIKFIIDVASGNPVNEGDEFDIGTFSEPISKNHPDFKKGQELAKKESGLDSKELDEKMESEDADDSRNFKFGYNSIDKKADNFSELDESLDKFIEFESK